MTESKSQERHRFGCAVDELETMVLESITPPAMLVMSIMSDAQEEIAFGHAETARQSLNRAKWILDHHVAAKDAQGRFADTREARTREGEPVRQRKTQDHRLPAGVDSKELEWRRATGEAFAVELTVPEAIVALTVISEAKGSRGDLENHILSDLRVKLFDALHIPFRDRLSSPKLEEASG